MRTKNVSQRISYVIKKAEKQSHKTRANIANKSDDSAFEPLPYRSLSCYKGCSAPLCPVNPLPNAQWFPDEDICNARHIAKPKWVRTQRKIALLFKKGRIRDNECFTVTMLERIERVRKGLHGMKPENLYRQQYSQNNLEAINLPRTGHLTPKWNSPAVRT